MLTFPEAVERYKESGSFDPALYVVLDFYGEDADDYLIERDFATGVSQEQRDYLEDCTGGPTFVNKHTGNVWSVEVPYVSAKLRSMTKSANWPDDEWFWGDLDDSEPDPEVDDLIEFVPGWCPQIQTER